MARQPKTKKPNLYGRTKDGGSVRAQTRIDTDGLPRVEFRRLDTSRAAFRHLNSSLWRRDGRSVVTMTTRVAYHDKGDR